MRWQDGLVWGKVIDEFTFHRLHQIMGVMQDTWLSITDQPSIVVGFDTRFGSDVSARVCAQVLAANGCKVYLASSPLPLGALLLAQQRKKAFGILVTGGMRAMEYNGLRLVHRSGEELTSQDWLVWSGRLMKYPFLEQLPFQEAVSTGIISIPPLHDEYIAFLRETVDCERLKRSQLRIVFDSLYGSVQGIFKHLLFNENGNVEEIHETRHSMFGGIIPSFGEANLQQLFWEVKQKNKNMGIMFDPEGRDWVFVKGKEGKIIESKRIIPLLQPLADRKELSTRFPGWKKDGILCTLLFLELIAS